MLHLGITEGRSGCIQYISPEDIVRLQTAEGYVDILNDWLYWYGHPLL